MILEWTAPVGETIVLRFPDSYSVHHLSKSVVHITYLHHPVGCLYPMPSIHLRSERLYAYLCLGL